MEWFRRFMTGRYGGDQLALFLLVVSLILSFTGDLCRIPLLILISYLPLGFALFRMLSRNIYKRRMENEKFMARISPMVSWLNQLKRNWAEAKIYRFYHCPNCKQRLRVPRGKGKLIIICPKCRTEFKGKT